MQLHQKIGCESGGRLGVKGTGSNIVFQKKKVCKSGQKNEQHREFFLRMRKLAQLLQNWKLWSIDLKDRLMGVWEKIIISEKTYIWKRFVTNSWGRYCVKMSQKFCLFGTHERTDNVNAVGLWHLCKNSTFPLFHKGKQLKRVHPAPCGGWQQVATSSA